MNHSKFRYSVTPHVWMKLNDGGTVTHQWSDSARQCQTVSCGYSCHKRFSANLHKFGRDVCSVCFLIDLIDHIPSYLFFLSCHLNQAMPWCSNRHQWHLWQQSCWLKSTPRLELQTGCLTWCREARRQAAYSATTPMSRRCPSQGVCQQVRRSVLLNTDSQHAHLVE